jgi:hypothetical protein
MTYARVHDRTVAEDYYRAMQQVECEIGLEEPYLDGARPVAVPRDQLMTMIRIMEQEQPPPEALRGMARQIRLLLVAPAEPQRGRGVTWREQADTG